VKQHFIVIRRGAVALAAIFGFVACAAFSSTIHAAFAGGLEDGARAYAAGDYTGAAEQWRPLAEGGDALAQFNLALLQDNSKSSLFNSSDAAEWYRRAAQQGLPAAQYNLAIAYQSGRGVSKDTAMALFWMLIAARTDAAERLAPLLSKSEKENIVPRAKSWQAKIEEQTPPADNPETVPYMTLSIDDVKMIQRRLNMLGYDPGLIDGIAGNATQQAIAGFYKDRGMEWRHGPLSHRLLKILN